MTGISLTELIQRLTSRLSEADTEFFTTENKILWLNEAQDVICSHVPFTAETTWDVTIVPYQTFYLLDEECLQPSAATIYLSGGQPVRLNYTEPDTMDAMKSWMGGQRVPTQYLQLVVEGNKRPLRLAEDSDRSEIPASLATTIVDYAVGMAKFKDEEIGQHERAMASFSSHLNDLQTSRVFEQFDQHNRSRAYRGITNRGVGGFFRSYACTYRPTLEGMAIELYGISA